MRRDTGAILIFLMVLPFQHIHARSSSDSTKLATEFIAISDFYLSFPDSAITISVNNLRLAIDGNLTQLEGSYYYLLSKVHWAKGNYKLSTEYGFKALRIVKNTSRIEEWGHCLLALGRTFTDLHNFTQGSGYINSAIRLASDQKNTNLLADAYREKSLLLVEQKKYDSALYYSDKGIAMYERKKDMLNASILYGRKARIYFLLKNFKASVVYTRKSILFDSLTGNRRALGISYLQAAQNAFSLKKTDSAVYYLHKSIAINSLFGNTAPLVRSHVLLADIYLSKNQPVMAVQQLKVVNQLKDSLYNLQQTGQIQGMQALYDLESKENTIKLLEQEKKNQRLIEIFLSVGIVLLLLTLFFVWRWRTVQSKANRALAKHNKAIEEQKIKIEAQAKNLEELNQLKTKLFSVIGHDLRGPLANLHALLELLTSNLLSNEEFVSLSEKIKAHLSITQRTLENLLNWSLSQMDGIKTQEKKIEIHQMFDETVRLMAEYATRKKVSLDKTEVQHINILVDSNQLQLVLRNLIHNAIKFSKEDGRVILSAHLEGRFCRVMISDFGIGMSAEEIGTVNRFSEHFTKTGTHHEKGTGLGLILCREFISRMGGELTIESHEGKGTQVSFTIPLAP